jgi:hypothetical protein
MGLTDEVKHGAVDILADRRHRHPVPLLSVSVPEQRLPIRRIGRRCDCRFPPDSSRPCSDDPRLGLLRDVARDGGNSAGALAVHRAWHITEYVQTLCDERPALAHQSLPC